MKENNSLFEKVDVWETYGFQSILTYRLPLIMKLIPDDVESIADIGCGNGIITNELNKKYQTIGIDSSEKALKYVKGKTLLSRVENIKLEDNSYDMVLCSEVLEHLPGKILTEGIKQLSRISRNYVLVTVPYNEVLGASNVKCPNCSSVFHVTQHVNSFTEESLVNLFSSDFAVKSVFADGPLVRSYNSTLLKIKNWSGVYYISDNEKLYCEDCGNTSFSKQKGNLVSKATNFTNRIISKKKPYWLFCLMEKKTK